MSRERNDVTLEDGKLFSFIEGASPGEPAQKFLNIRCRVNRDKHRAAGGYWPEAQDKGDKYRERCGLTSEFLKPEDGVTMVISNQAGVPNRAISTKKFKEMTPQEAAIDLLASWHLALASWNKHGHWFT